MLDQNAELERAVPPSPEPPRRRSRLICYAHNHSPLLRVLAITVAVVLVVYIGSQIAHDSGQSVEWYTGFGQWLGAIASFAAAATAVWIATADRRRADQIRADERNQENRDLARQAGLVSVTARTLGQRQPLGPAPGVPSVAILNRRSEPIFAVEIVKLVLRGEEQALPLELDMTNGFVLYPRPEKHKDRFPLAAEFEGITVEPDQLLGIHHPSGLPGGVADYVAVAYTDRSGRRWQVDTCGEVTRM